jgi:hypothetical protein
MLLRIGHLLPKKNCGARRLRGRRVASSIGIPRMQLILVAVMPANTKSGCGAGEMCGRVADVVVVFVGVKQFARLFAKHATTQLATALVAPRPPAAHTNNEYAYLRSPADHIIAAVIFQRPPFAPRTLFRI